jgi:hypothetical protein
MSERAKPQTGRWVLLGILGVIVLAALTQRTVTAGVAHFLADIWVSTVSVVAKLFGSIFGVH